MLGDVLLWGAVVGLIHFVATGLLYGNPWIDGLYQRAMAENPGVKRWENRGAYLVRQFLGTQVEVYILAAIFVLFRNTVEMPGLGGAAVLGAVLAGVRVYPRSWNMWIQSTYPNHLIAVESVNGVISTLVVILGLEFLMGA